MKFTECLRLAAKKWLLGSLSFFLPFFVFMVIVKYDINFELVQRVKARLSQGMRSCGEGYTGNIRIFLPFSLQFWREEDFHRSHVFFCWIFFLPYFLLSTKREKFFFSLPFSLLPFLFPLFSLRPNRRLTKKSNRTSTGDRPKTKSHALGLNISLLWFKAPATLNNINAFDFVNPNSM